MTKKQYIIIGITILIFIILIAFILIKGNKSTWTKEILNSNSYTITKIDCNNNETKLDNSIMNKIDSTWKELSNNGPWLGDTNTCYETISIEYDKNDFPDVQKTNLTFYYYIYRQKSTVFLQMTMILKILFYHKM